MNARRLLLAIVVGATGCSPRTAGSCSQNTSGTMVCVDYSGDITADSARSACTGGMGSYSTGSCSTSNVLGRCLVQSTISGTQTTSTLFFYNPLTETSARQTCTLLRGSYSPG